MSGHKTPWLWRYSKGDSKVWWIQRGFLGSKSEQAKKRKKKVAYIGLDERNYVNLRKGCGAWLRGVQLLYLSFDWKARTGAGSSDFHILWYRGLCITITIKTWILLKAKTGCNPHYLGEHFNVYQKSYDICPG